MQHKEKIAISIDRDLLEKIDRSVDGVRVKNRSHAFELLLRKALHNDVEEAIIFAGGKRKDRRALIEHAGKPFLQHSLEWLKTHGIKKVYIALSNKEGYEKVFGRGFHLGIEIEYIEEKEPLGTAGSLLALREKIQKTFVAMNGDVLCSFNLKDMIEFHRKSTAIVTIALREVEAIERYGAVLLDGERITNFVEKPKKEEVQTSLINAGVYVMEPTIFNLLPKRGSLESDVFPKLVTKRSVAGYVFSSLWIDAEKLGEKT